MGISPVHLVIILAVVLLLFGPKRLPGLGKGIGEAIRGFKKGLVGDEIDVTPKNPNDQINASMDQDHNSEKTRSKTKQDS